MPAKGPLTGLCELFISHVHDRDTAISNMKTAGDRISDQMAKDKLGGVIKVQVDGETYVFSWEQKSKLKWRKVAEKRRVKS